MINWLAVAPGSCGTEILFLFRPIPYCLVRPLPIKHLHLATGIEQINKETQNDNLTGSSLRTAGAGPARRILPLLSPPQLQR